MTKYSSVILSLIMVLSMSIPASGDNFIKKPNVSGQFYDADGQRLSRGLDDMFREASVEPLTEPVEIIIAPHAGYVYSGATAAHSFKAVKNQKISTVVILAPSHFYGLSGISVWEQGGFETPLGVAEVDAEFTRALLESDDAVSFDRKAFDKEHSLEVEIPFVQRTFPDAKIVPVVMGQPHPDKLVKFAKALDGLMGEREDVLVVVSTDFSHYHEDKIARKLDQATIEAVRSLDAQKVYEGCRTREMEMCGCIPVVTSMLLAQLRGATQVDLLKYANSGDVSGDRDRVVGYGALIFRQKSASAAASDQALSDPQKRRLLAIARQAIDLYVSEGKTVDVQESDTRLLEEEGAFVSIYRHGRLRGCIGNILGNGPLCLTVRDVAISSAVRDHRFKPLQKDELDDIDLEVSVLSKPRRIKDINEIEMGKHGVIISQGRNSGVFLPQVATSTGWSRDEFLSELCSQKAGLPRDCWKDPDRVNIEIFSADVFADKDFANP